MWFKSGLMLILDSNSHRVELTHGQTHTRGSHTNAIIVVIGLPNSCGHHMRMHTGGAFDVTLQAAKKHASANHSNIIYICDQLDFQTGHSPSLKRHMITHTHETKHYKCERCSLRTHRRYFYCFIRLRPVGNEYRSYRYADENLYRVLAFKFKILLP